MRPVTESQDLESLRSDLAFEMQTRAERFTRIGETEPDDPEIAEPVHVDPDEPPETDPVRRVIGELVRTLGLSTVTTGRLLREVGASLGFDLRALSSLADKMAEQEREIEMLRRTVEDLRRSR